MTTTFLQAELSCLIQDSKKKFPDVRTAAEKSLADLKALTVTSESQLANDLLRRATFIDPFVLACQTRTPKLATSGVVGLQRLTASRAISNESLKDVLDAFRAVAALGVEVQLKILQTLPSLLQFHAADITGERLEAILDICGVLQASKTDLVSNTAAATFQQLITTVFERFEQDNESAERNSDEASSDALKVFQDLCALLKGDEGSYLRIKTLTPSFLLEVIGNVLLNHEAAFSRRSVLIVRCRTTLMPALLQIVGTRAAYNPTLRALRILFILMSRYADKMPDECGQALLSMVKSAESDSSLTWKRVLCMEVFRAICQEAALIPRLFELLDQGDSKPNAVGALLAALARIASEDPVLIGLSLQSTVPYQMGSSTSTQDQILIDPSGIGGAIGTVASADANVTGISAEWSVVKVPLMEQLDRLEAGDIPTTYIYTLVINCLVAIAEGMSKFVMPLSVPSKQQRMYHETAELLDDHPINDTEGKTSKGRLSGTHKYQQLLNPLTLKDHPRSESIKVCASFIIACWPAFLAACSTFLNCALDSRYYHSIIRAFQKMTQVSGILELTTPRDAFLTCLAKAAVPVSAQSVARPAKNVRSVSARSETLNGGVQSPNSPVERQSFDITRNPLNLRNLLCMRALLNLGVALGPSMKVESWFIILETLQQVDVLHSEAPAGPVGRDALSQNQDVGAEEIRNNFASEVAAVKSASNRLFESTRSYSDEAVEVVLSALFRLVGYESNGDQRRHITTPNTQSQKINRNKGRMHQASRSLSGVFKAQDYHAQEFRFVLEQIEVLTKVNLYRFAAIDSVETTWNYIIPFLLEICQRHGLSGRLDVAAANIINSIAIGTTKLLNKASQDDGDTEALQSRCIAALLGQIEAEPKPRIADETDSGVVIHRKLLETLENIVGQSGESLRKSWRVVFEILRYSVQTKGFPADFVSSDAPSTTILVNSKAGLLISAAFQTVQLIVSDFSKSFPPFLAAELTDILLLYGTQLQDLNVSLTTIALLSNIGETFAQATQTIEVANVVQQELPKSQVTTSDVWHKTLRQLSRLCGDERIEVRTTAIQTVVRVLDGSEKKLSAMTWTGILRELVISNVIAYDSKLSSHTSHDSQWEQSLCQLLEGPCESAVGQLDVLSRAVDFSKTWSELLEALESVLTSASLTSWAVIFATIAHFLSAFRHVEGMSGQYADQALHIWRSKHPTDWKNPSSVAGADAKIETVPNQAAFAQHAALFREAFQLLKESNATAVPSSIVVADVVQSAKKTIFDCTHPPYTSDIKALAMEQEQIITILSYVRDLSNDEQGGYISLLLDFTQTPLRATTVRPAGPQPKELQHPTFVAFSTTCVELLDQVTGSMPRDMDVFEHLLPSACLEALAALTGTKYSSIPQNADRPLWQIAARTANSVAAKVIEYMDHTAPTSQAEHLATFLASVVTLATSVLSAPTLPDLITSSSVTSMKVFSDEAIDIQSFVRLQKIVTPTFGLASIPDALRKSYIQTIFHASLLAKPWFFDFPNNLKEHPLQDFHKVRMGTVTQPAFHPRQGLPYTALDALFSLVTRIPADNDDDETFQRRLRLAETAAPYLLLRIAHSFKRFVADQPLRGLTPFPEPLKKEILYLLTKSLETRTEDNAFVALMTRNAPSGRVRRDVQGTSHDDSGGDGKCHLKILYPLLLRMRDIWSRTMRLTGGGAWQEDDTGRAIEKKMGEWCGVIGEDWGLRDF